jgi:hypothetical protein
MPRLFMENTCNFSHHKQRKIYNLKHKKHPCKPAIANDFKLHETNRGRGRLKEGVQYYFINIVLSVKLKKIIIEKSLVISLFSSEFTLIYLYLP